ncbi:related to nucleotide-binding protein NBP35 [Sporisorium reilianum SRZ2]|uniref:Related to nucleotide-binding protein NBP35 n=1 Tax=Sporisorium reilianum (strain SRZ2) TaxID=999809 RepID=E6ZPE2_SPORE|nr:related to nucleotide-binding protein NBP35 [Sporisorium reilianum SRZ2]
MSSHKALRELPRAIHSSASILRAPSIPMAAPCTQRNLSSSSTSRSHENPLGLPRNNQRIPPTMPRRGTGGPPQPRRIPHVKHVVCVSSGKGGVGKSTISANLAVALSLTHAKPRVGLLDLDIFGPSVPKLMGLEGMGEPELTSNGALIPMKNHGVSCMSMGFLLGNDSEEAEERVVAWRGMMVMKATQQLLFDVDWRLNPLAPTPASPDALDASNTPLDVLVIDMPPGTGDVALSLAQLVKVDAALVVTTPQQVALLDAKKGVSMFRKTNVPVAGLVLNMSHFVSPDTGRVFEMFGTSTAVERYAQKQGLDVLARVPLQPQLSAGGDEGIPATLRETLPTFESGEQRGQEQANHIRAAFLDLADKVWARLAK